VIQAASDREQARADADVDPLNLPSWRKWAILVLVASYGCAAVVLASGLGPIFSAASHLRVGVQADDR
jgi:hypothetical protein